MLLLLFKVASRHYAIEAQRVVQVVSSRMLQRSERVIQSDILKPNASKLDASKSDASNAQVGLLQWEVNQSMNNIGQSIALVPVIDLSQLLMGVDCPNTIGTRIMVVQDETDRLWGLMAASMVQTWKIDDDLWVESERQQILMQDQTLIYGLSVDQLLTQVRNSCDQFRVRTVAVERDRTASQN
jgi:chemotaxis signal transduction protein